MGKFLEHSGHGLVEFRGESRLILGRVLAECELNAFRSAQTHLGELIELTPPNPSDSLAVAQENDILQGMTDVLERWGA